jgi:hypothetical protein
MSLGQTRLLAVAMVGLFYPAAHGQWLKYPTPGIPRTKDGKPDLSGPAPRTPDGKPDLSGIWGRGGRVPELKDVPLRPEVRALAVQISESQNNKDQPLAQCLPHFMVHIAPLSLYKIVQTPGLIVILYESQGMPLPRQIFTDGRPLPDDPTPSWNGYSSGKWEGDTLVVQSNGFRDGIWLDASGSPMTEAARMLEKFRRPRYGTLEIEITVDDPKAYTAPWTVKLKQPLVVDTELLDYICLENERDARHFVAK